MADSTIPGAQNPHWKALLERNTILERAETVEADAFDRGDVVALRLNRQDEAAADRSAVHENGARTAVPSLASDLGALGADLLSEHIEQNVGGSDMQLPFLTVDLHC